MLTSRGGWFLFLVLLQVTLGTLLSERGGAVIATIGLILFAWFSLEWMFFKIRVEFAMPKLTIRRTVRVDGREVSVIWAGQNFDIVVEATLGSRIPLPYLTLQDRPPSGCERKAGHDREILALRRNAVGKISYTLLRDVPGEVRFEGVRVQIADIQGFFYSRAFIRQPAIFLVLPPLADAEGDRRTTKSHNILPPPGLHRLRQPGGGSELHDLRDYRPGDPPKMIAWKASARRDRLIIKEFESDVPVRCTLFVDASQSVRLGPPHQTMLNQITTIASNVSQAALSDRDHVGLVLFDDSKTEILRPARSSRHLIDLLHRLARANSAAPISPQGDADALLQLANPLAHEIYPDLMDRRINRLPLGMFWRPILDSRGAWLIPLLLTPLMLILLWAASLFMLWTFDFHQGIRTTLGVAITVHSWFDSWAWPIGIALVGGLLALLAWFAFGMSGFFPRWSRERTQRKQLSALFAVLDEAPIGTEAAYLDDDARFVERAQRFLAEHHRRYPLVLFDDQGRYLFRSEEKVDVLARALLHSVARGRDNELFVIMAELFELDNRLEPLLRAARLARARHHQVMIICPWLVGIPVLPENLDRAELAKTLRVHALRAGFRGMEAQLFRQTAERYHRSFQRLRREFGKCGVLLVKAEQHESVRLILNRMDRLRGVRARR